MMNLKKSVLRNDKPATLTPDGPGQAFARQVRNFRTCLLTLPGKPSNNSHE